MMNPTQFLAAVVKNRDAVAAKFADLLARGDVFSAGLMLNDVQFANRQVDEAAEAAVKGVTL